MRGTLGLVALVLVGCGDGGARVVEPDAAPANTVETYVGELVRRVDGVEMTVSDAVVEIVPTADAVVTIDGCTFNAPYAPIEGDPRRVWGFNLGDRIAECETGGGAVVSAFVRDADLDLQIGVRLRARVTIERPDDTTVTVEFEGARAP
ncbi:hypothetical protein [Sandaracinus amylolyticus]|uniref:hypothetical protein n=1 Tax=Sandaracinus amylolyticus TaxID=927083 RepID=UPI001F39B9B6|nr:hypothetical protein [Sandaracinus amylolyticus]UJR79847.1 Hypothetical protein I5071_18860 [Sandaracinus amylolyticus]